MALFLTKKFNHYNPKTKAMIKEPKKIDWMVFRDMRSRRNQRFKMSDKIFQAKPGNHKQQLTRSHFFEQLESLDPFKYGGTAAELRYAFNQSMPGVEPMKARQFSRELETGRLVGRIPPRTIITGAHIRPIYLCEAGPDDYILIVTLGVTSQTMLMRYDTARYELGEGNVEETFSRQESMNIQCNLSVPMERLLDAVEAFVYSGKSKLKVLVIDQSKNREQTRKRIEAQLRNLLLTIPMAESDKTKAKIIQARKEFFPEALEKSENKKVLSMVDADGYYRLYYFDKALNKWKTLRDFCYDYHDDALAASYYLPGMPGLDVRSLFADGAVDLDIMKNCDLITNALRFRD